MGRRHLDLQTLAIWVLMGAGIRDRWAAIQFAVVSGAVKLWPHRNFVRFHLPENGHRFELDVGNIRQMDFLDWSMMTYLGQKQHAFLRLLQLVLMIISFLDHTEAPGDIIHQKDLSREMGGGLVRSRFRTRVGHESFLRSKPLGHHCPTCIRQPSIYFLFHIGSPCRLKGLPTFMLTTSSNHESNINGISTASRPAYLNCLQKIRCDIQDQHTDERSSVCFDWSLITKLPRSAI